MPINSFENYPMSWRPSIDKTKKPIYQALARQLEQDILNGVLLPGTKLFAKKYKLFVIFITNSCGDMVL